MSDGVMTLREAIDHARETGLRMLSCEDECACGAEHLQLADWLEELQMYRCTGMSPEEVQDMIHIWNMYGGDEGIMDAFRCAVELANIRGSGEKGVNG